MTTEPPNKDFVFVGYLIQEPYWRNWPRRDGFRVASIEREIHPAYDKPQWDSVTDFQNITRFLPEYPHLEKLSLEPHACKSVLHRQSPGWVVCAYAYPRDLVEKKTLISTDGAHTLNVFAYASQIRRSEDGLVFLGYEIEDAEILFLSILHNCGYTVDQVRQMAGNLNEYGLLSSPEDAYRFIEAIKIDPDHLNIVPSHGKGIPVQIWGQP
jgi:hypothetical protein